MWVEEHFIAAMVNFSLPKQGGVIHFRLDQMQNLTFVCKTRSCGLYHLWGWLLEMLNHISRKTTHHCHSGSEAAGKRYAPIYGSSINFNSDTYCNANVITTTRKKFVFNK